MTDDTEFQRLLAMLPPKAPPDDRLERFMAVEATLHFIASSPHRQVIFGPQHVAIQAKMRGIPLPLRQCEWALGAIIKRDAGRGRGK